MLRHILVGCDGTAAGRDAATLGAQLASVARAGLTLVGVYPPSVSPVARLSERYALRAQAEARLGQERDAIAPRARVEAVCDTSVTRALRRYAEQRPADLVVVGSHRAADTGHTMISRRARQLLYDAPFAVAVAAHGLHERANAIGAIGVGYDGRPEAELALDLASDLAFRSDAQLHVRRVVESQVPALILEQWATTADLALAWEAARQVAHADTVGAMHSLYVPAEVSATVGDPGFELRGLSETVGLLVVGSRRWGPDERVVSGAVAETLLSYCSCSVIVVPRLPADDEQRLWRARRRRRLHRYPAEV